MKPHSLGCQCYRCGVQRDRIADRLMLGALLLVAAGFAAASFLWGGRP